MRTKTLFFIAAVCISILFTSCSYINISEQDGSKENEYNFLNSKDDVIDIGPVRGGVLKLYSTIPDTLNPILTNNKYVRDYSVFVFESLVTLDKNQKPVPTLAKSWEISDDGLTWTFHLEENVFWHDNMPFTAEDVEFTINAIISSPNSSYKPNVSNITMFSAIDRKTFRIVLKNPNSFTAELMTFPILPKHYFEGEELASSPKNNSPMGTGPYKFAEYNPGQYVKLKSNENWWKSEQDNSSDLKIPYIQEIEIRLYDKTKSRTDAFQGGDVDVLTIDRGLWSKYNGRTDITMKKYISNEFEYIAFNLSNKILKLPEVRQAIAYAVDKTKIINSILHGEAIASDLPLIPDTWLNDTNAVFYSPDKEKARKLLEDGGWKESNGLLYKKINGANTALKLEMLVNEDNSTRLKVAEEIKNQLKEVGIELTITKLKWDEEMKRIDRKRFDMVFIGCQITSVPDISFLYSSESGQLNISGYKNEEVDEYLRKITMEKNDDVKKSYYSKLKELINQDVPYLGLYFYNEAVVYSKRIKGEFNPYLWNKYFDFVRWYTPMI
ncbi:MAG TPA: peptide ABC transporter substrate-binding protein [Acetivibrio clariflavus]|nr:peptide ABC transporter substrate-binding protein [Acetivibrio clariflavus]